MDTEPSHENTEQVPSRIEELNKSLYSREGVETRHLSHSLSPHDAAVDGAWKPPESNPFQYAPEPEKPDRTLPFLKKFLIASGIFFVVALGVALYAFLGGANVLSAGNIDITIDGSVSAGGGEELPLTVGIVNKNNAPIEAVDLVAVYPDGTRKTTDLGSELKRYRETIGTVASGETQSRKISAVLFGQEGDKKIITVGIEYRIKGSSATFSKNKEYEVAISSAPLSLTVDSVKETNDGQEVVFTATIVSTSPTLLKNIVFRAAYPYGFEYESATPSPSSGTEMWRLGDLKSGTTRTITIKGKVSGQEGDERSFVFAAGTGSATDDRAIATTFLQTTNLIAIKKPFVSANLSFDGTTGPEYVSRLGRAIRADITWTNNLSSQVSDITIEAKIAGTLLDAGSVSSGNGFFRSGDNTIIFNKTSSPELALADPGATGHLSFSFASQSPRAGSGASKNGTIAVSVNVHGKRVSDANVPEDIVSVTTKTVKFASELGLSTRALRASGAFVNHGPIPPRVGSETTYTVVWTITNSSNTVSGVRVHAILPPYVAWLSAFSPNTENVSYNPIGGEVEWNVGDVAGGVGFNGSPRELSFQVGLTPSGSQIGSEPVLIGAAVVEGDDNFTGTPVSSGTRSPLTTNLTTDPSFRAGDGIVR